MWTYRRNGAVDTKPLESPMRNKIKRYVAHFVYLVDIYCLTPGGGGGRRAGSPAAPPR